MTQPAYIIPANYYVNTSVDDVQDIIDDLATLLVANGWTQAPAGTFRCPNDPWGRWFKVAFTRVSATRLQAQMTDDFARTTEVREMQISGTVSVEYFYGTRYFHVLNMNVTTDSLWASLLSLAPESETVHNRYCTFFGSRNSAGTENINNTLAAIVIDNTGVYAIQSYPKFLQLLNAGIGAASGMPLTYHLSGARRWAPAWNVGPDDASGYVRFRGKLYNVLHIDQGIVTVNADYTVPIDEATTAPFRIVNMPTASGSGNTRRAIRRS